MYGISLVARSSVVSDGVLDQLTNGRIVTDPTTIATMENVQLCKRRSNFVLIC